MRRTSQWTALGFALLAAVGVAACQGCHAGVTQRGPTGADAASSAKPTVRLYVMSTVAGALEPCGCSKDQLGGIDHFAAFVRSQADAAPVSLALGAGPMLFLDPKVRAGDGTQDLWKAEALAGTFKSLGVAAWAPGANDWAGGADELSKCRDTTGATLLAANLPGMTGTLVREVGGVKLGIVGVSDPRDKAGAYPEGVKPTAASPFDAMKAGLAEVKQRGATVLIGLAAMPRGEAMRLADKLPELHMLVIGKPIEGGEANDAAKAPVLAGTTLVVETANHLQTVSVVDLFVRPGAEGPLVFADAGGVARADELLGLAARIRELEARINSWEKDHTVKAEDLAARKADLEKLRAEKATKEAAQPDVKGSFFRYTSVEMRDKLGRDKAAAGEILAYYKRVNEHNKVALASRVPATPEPGQASYIGVDACTDCHDDARKVWDKTTHATAYKTLQDGFKEFNLDCVSCHVTGYDKPGGSTVTRNQKLQNVQCETCHGPGSLHAKDPKAKGLIVGAPKTDLCVGCHHPPHVEGFDPKQKLPLILGPGHGQKKG
jgi:2',3'-cyclic-nucleotide 2'-phosphodiesterase (5'-nucleotidase family)